MLSSLVHSQVDVHRIFGGVVPEIAAREHVKIIDALAARAMEEAGTETADLDAVAVTAGPGLIGALLVGASWARGFALSSGLPLIPVNHVHAHVHGALLGIEEEDLFPCIAAVVSGGHTHLYYMPDPVRFELLAWSVDDACGESFDKVAKIMELGYPGGPVIEKAALGGDPRAYPMPVMVADKDRMIFSYSGLKTHMVHLINKESPIDADARRDLCASFQEEALGQLIRKINGALERRPDCRSLLVAGGVAANQRFRTLVDEQIPVRGLFPPLRFCSDNGAMIAALGYHVYQQGGDFSDLSWDPWSRYPYGS